MRASDVCYRSTTSRSLSDTHVIRRTNQPLSATNDAETIDEATRTKLAAAAAAVHNKTPPVSHSVVKSRPGVLLLSVVDSSGLERPRGGAEPRRWRSRINYAGIINSRFAPPGTARRTLGSTLTSGRLHCAPTWSVIDPTDRAFLPRHGAIDRPPGRTDERRLPATQLPPTSVDSKMIASSPTCKVK